MSRVTAATALAALLAAGSVVTGAQTPTHEYANTHPSSLEGRPAPRLDGRDRLDGVRVPSLDELKGKVVLLFFWAHWCEECRAESPTMATIVDKYKSDGLVIIAPTQRYGFINGGRPAAPDRELRYIIETRKAHYGFMLDVPVPVGEANHKAYGADAVPLHVLIDRLGIVRYYHAGRMSAEGLDAAIRRVLDGSGRHE